MVCALTVFFMLYAAAGCDSNHDEFSDGLHADGGDCGPLLTVGEEGKRSIRRTPWEAWDSICFRSHWMNYGRCTTMCASTTSSARNGTRISRPESWQPFLRHRSIPAGTRR